MGVVVVDQKITEISDDDNHAIATDFNQYGPTPIPLCFFVQRSPLLNRKSKGVIVLLIGFVTIVIGFAIPETEEHVGDWQHPEFCCGKCPLFRTEECERKEQNYNMAPCEKYYEESRAR